MRLPGELRNRIYSLCMVSDASIDPIWGCFHDLNQTDKSEFCLERSAFYPQYTSQLHPELPYEPYEVKGARMANMTQVCKAWRVEALHHFYGTNVFKLPIGKHLHERRKPAHHQWFTAWPVWRASYWPPKAPGPAGRFARRCYYPPWLRKRPQDAFVVMRLVLHDYRPCPHWVPQHWAQTLRGGCMILLDLQKRTVRAVRSVDWKDSFELWNCDVCWKQFGENVSRLNQNEEMGELFVEFKGKMNAESAVRVVDGVRRILEAEYE